MTSSDRLAEAAQGVDRALNNAYCDLHGEPVDIWCATGHIVTIRKTVAAALAAYDADAPLRQAQQAVIDAADTWEKKRLQNVATAGAIPPTVVDLIAAVRRLRELAP